MQVAPGSALAPHLRFPQLLQQQFLQGSIRWGGEEVDPPALAIFPEPLDIVLHGLLVMLQAVPPKSHFLDSAVLGIDQSQISKGRWIQLLGRQYLDNIHLEPAPD